MNKKALEDYDMLEWDTAKRTLLDALMAGKKAGLESHPVVARTYVHLAAVYLTGFKNRDKAIQSFVRALEIDPGIQLSKAIATAEVNEAFAEAQRKVKGGGGGDSPPPASPSPGRRRKPVMDEDGNAAPSVGRRASRPQAAGFGRGRIGRARPARQDQRAGVPGRRRDPAGKAGHGALRGRPNLPVAKVFLMYRMPGKDEYVEAEMKKTPKGWHQATIPKKAVTGKSLQFYFEGRNTSGKPVVANGAESSPNIMLIVEEGAAEEEQAGKKKKKKGAEEEEENPLEEKEGPYKPKLRLGRIDRAREGLDERFGKRKFWIGHRLRKRLRLRERGRARGAVRSADRSSCPAWPGRGWGTWRLNSAIRSTRTSPCRWKAACSTSRSPRTTRSSRPGGRCRRWPR